MTVSVFEVPFKAQPQRFTITILGIEYNLTLTWNVPSQIWLLSIADSNSAELVSSIPLVAGADLLEQFAYLNFGGKLIAQTDHDINLPPSYTNLGSLGHVYFVVIT